MRNAKTPATKTERNPLGSSLRLMYLFSQAALLPLATYAIGRYGLSDNWSGILTIGFYFFGLFWAMINVLLFTMTFPAKTKEALLAVGVPIGSLLLSIASPDIDLFDAAYGVFFSSFLSLALVCGGIFIVTAKNPSAVGVKRLPLGAWIGIGVGFVFCLIFIYGISGPFLGRITTGGYAIAAFGWLSQIVFQTRSLWLVFRGKTGGDIETMEVGNGMNLTIVLVTLLCVFASFFSLVSG